MQVEYDSAINKCALKYLLSSAFQKRDQSFFILVVRRLFWPGVDRLYEEVPPEILL